MGSLEDILERVQYKFASIIGELCGDPLALSQFAIWVDLRLAEYKLRGSISLDCTGRKIDPDWLKSLQTIHTDTSQSTPVSVTTVPTHQPQSQHISPVHSSSNPNLPHSQPHGSLGPFSTQVTPVSNLPTPPLAHSGQTHYTQLAANLDKPTPTPNHIAAPTPTSGSVLRGEPDSRKRSATPTDVVVVKQEPVEQEDFHATCINNSRNASKPSFLETTSYSNKVNASCVSAANIPPNATEQAPLSPSKIPRLNEGPPPLKPIVDPPDEHSNMNMVISCCVGSGYRDESQDSHFQPDPNGECLESDIDIMASTSSDVSDVPEDLSTSRFNPVSWNGHSAPEVNSCRAVLQPFGEFSCLRNGPQFSQKWHQFVTNRSINLKSMSSDRYRGYMDLLKVAQSKVHVPKSVKEHKMLYKFDLWRDGSSERLIKKRHKDTDPVRFYISDDQLYHALLAVHLDSGHGGIKKMLTLCKERYANITADAVKLFTHLCYDCQTRKRTLPPKHRDNS